jgi:hypothetical protein
MTETKAVTVLELKRLLIELTDKRPDICVRFRLIGEMWFQHFTRIIVVTETGVIINDEVSARLIRVRDLSNVMQFEIDRGFQNFKPHYHYTVNMMDVSNLV